MRKFLASKNTVLILGGLSILVIIYLIASLGGLFLKPAVPFAYLQEDAITAPGALPDWNGFIYTVVVIFAVLLIVLYFLLSPEQRKKFLQTLAWFLAAGLIVAFILSRYSLGMQVQQPPDKPGGVVATLASEPTETPIPEVTPSVFTPPQVSAWTSYLVALGFLLVVAGVWGWLVWRKKKMAPPYDVFADNAQSALNDIEAGKDWGDSILNSYSRMNKAVADWRGIHRQAGMTPGEFAGYLVSTHLPSEAVNRLTKLFERVRYGEKKATRKDIREAVECLTAILEYCRGAQ